VANAENQYHEAVVFQGANEAVVSDAVFPELAQPASEPCSDLSRIVKALEALVKKLQNPIRSGLIELVQLPQRGW
jgi:hypothetical protein